MRQVQLTEEEQAHLRQRFKATADRNLRDRIQAVLMSAQGRPRQQVAADLACSPRTVLRWLTQYLSGGLDALVIHWGSGRPSKIPEALEDEILGWIRGGPVSAGLDRANWTYAELAEHLYRTHGIRVSRRAMCDFCRARGVRPYRPTYRYLRGSPQKQQRAAEELASLEKKSGGGRAGAAVPG